MKISTIQNHSEHTAGLYAAEFTGIGGMTIIRLVPESLRIAEEQTLHSVGLLPTGQHIVGYAATRAVGFPAWPIIIDPENAHHALNLVGDLEWARSHAEHKANKVKKRFDVLTAELTTSAPHFVPTLLEELSRCFAAAGHKSRARQYFSKAREIERMYNLDIDLERHAAIFAEFANLGVIKARDFTAEARAVGKRIAPQAAWEYFLKLSISRTQAGTRPYGAMVRELRKLAESAGISVAESDKALLDGIIESVGFRKATVGFFNTVHDSLCMLAQADSRYREALLVEKCKKLTIDAYFSLLEDAGALAHLANDKDKFAQWLVKFMEKELDSFDRLTETRSQKLTDTVLLAGDTLAGHRVALVGEKMDLNLIDALCCCNVEWDVSLAGTVAWYIKWRDWANDEKYSDPATQRRDLAGILRTEQLRDLVMERLDAEEISDLLDALLAYEPTTHLFRMQLERYAEERTKISGFAPDWLKWQYHYLPYLAHPRIMEQHPEAMAKIFAFDPVIELQLRLKHGIFNEFTWPAVEESITRLREAHPQAKVVFHETYPGVAIQVEDTIEIIDGNKVIARGHIPKGSHLTAAYAVGSQVAVLYDDCNSHSYTCWLGEIAASDQSRYHISHNHDAYSIPLGTTRLTGQGILTYPVLPKNFGGEVIGTGPHYLAPHIETMEWETGTFIAKDYFDAISHGESLPGINLSGLPTSKIPEEYEFKPWYSTIVPVQPTTRHSLCGTLNDQHISLVFTNDTDSNGLHYLWTPLGSFTSRGFVRSAINRPGGGVWLLCADPYRNGRHFMDVDSDLSSFDLHNEFYDITSTWVHKLPLSAYHQLQPRDLTMSTNLRATTHTQAAELLAAPTSDTVARIFGTNEVLTTEILRTVTQVQKLTTTMREFREKATTPPQRFLSKAAVQLLWKLQDDLSSAPNLPWEDSDLVQLFAKPGTVVVDKEAAKYSRWWSLLGKEKAIVSYLASPLYDPKIVVELCDWLLHTTEIGIFGSGWRHYTITAEGLYTDTNHWWHGAWIYREDWWDGDTIDVLVHPEHTIMEKIWPRIHKQPPDMSLTAQEFTSCILAIREWATHRHTAPRQELILFGGLSLSEAVQELAATTMLTIETSRYLLGGTLANFDYQWDLTKKKNRSKYGLNRIAAKVAMNQMNAITNLDWLRAAGVDDTFCTTGLNITAIAHHLQKLCPNPMHLSVEQFYDLYKNYEESTRYTNLALSSYTTVPSAPEDNCAINMGNYLEILMYLIFQLDLADPRRKIFAQKLTELKNFSCAQQWENIGTMELGGDYHHKNFTYRIGHNSQTIRVLTEGHLDDLIADLQTESTSAGQPFDPLVAAPDIVADAVHTLDVTEDSARYFLQILTLVKPTDENIRVWNGWKKKHINQAAAPLVAKGLLVEATRAGSGRSRFLPGGWLEKTPESMPLEVWKAPHYLLWHDVKARPVITGCPPLQPLGKLFAEVWERYKGGDIPGYEELKTTRYRRR